MCGIAGLFSLRPEPLLPTYLRAMTDAIHHRGPDGEGFVLFDGDSSHICGGRDTPQGHYGTTLPWHPRQQITSLPSADYHVGLGHRRLSIIDLSSCGHQPMCCPQRRYWISYNGEVYNYLELRKQLQELGHCFQSDSDTEVVLKSYLEWGEKCLNHFNGMFALIVYDAVERRVFAARDRFGIKPLYYWQGIDGMLALASEIKQFAPLPSWCAAVDHQSAYDYLTTGLTDHRPQSMFSGVRQLMGGEMLHYRLGDQAPTVGAWYTLEPDIFRGSFAEASTRFAELLEDSVRLRLRADVGVGSCLSGGLDSSSIVCLANQLLRANDAHHQQNTFSARSAEARFDESGFIEQVVDHCGVNAHYCVPQPEGLFQQMDRIIRHQDEPFGSTSIYAQWEVFDLVRQSGIKVMLDGQGADEQLAGYHGFFSNRFSELFRGFQWITWLRESRATVKMHGKGAAQYPLRSLIPAGLKPFARRIVKGQPKTPSWLHLEGVVTTPPFAGNMSLSIREQSLLQMSRSNLPMLLRYEDRNSMAHSIEARTPFLDYRLVEFVCSLPSEYRLQDGVTKKVMREGMKGVLPEAIRTRIDKIGFATAEEVWLKKQSPKLFVKMLDDAIAATDGLVDRSFLRQVEEVIAGKKAFDFQPWRVLNFGRWMGLNP